MREQATELQTPSRYSVLRISGKILAGCATLLGVVGAMLAIYAFVIESRSKPLVNLSIIDNQCLTRVVPVPSLGSHFSFRGRDVRNLWVSKIQLVNESRRNIIGLPGRDLMYSNLVVSVSNDFNIVSAELEHCEFEAKVGNSDNEITLSFEKWRPNQVCSIKVYSECTLGRAEGILPKFISYKDPFTQGELKIVDYKETVKPISMLRHFPYWIYTIMTWLGIAGFGIVFTSFLWWFILNWGKFFRSWRWNHKYRAAAIAVIESNGAANDGASMIAAMEDNFWRDNNIPKPPPRSDFIKSGKIDWEEVMGTNGFILIVLVLSFVALTALIYV